MGWDAGAGLPGPVSAQVEGQLPGGHRLSSARATAGHLSRAVPCWEITSPGELKAWPGLLVSFPCGEVSKPASRPPGTEAGGREPTTASREGASLRRRDLSGLEAVAVLCSRLGGHSRAGPRKTLH